MRKRNKQQEMLQEINISSMVLDVATCVVLNIVET
jgi:hypothetical protein